MKNNKGQALVEFILILPVILIIIFTSIDIYNLIIKKDELKTELNDQIELYTSNKITIDDLKSHFGKDYTLKITNNGKYSEIYLSKNIKIISPISKLFIGNNDVNVKRVIPIE